MNVTGQSHELVLSLLFRNRSRSFLFRWNERAWPVVCVALNR